MKTLNYNHHYGPLVKWLKTSDFHSEGGVSTTPRATINRPVVQFWLEHRIVSPKVVGSSPIGMAIKDSCSKLLEFYKTDDILIGFRVLT